MPGTKPTFCRHCGTTIRPDESLCPRCLLQAAASDDATAAEERIFQQAQLLEPAARLSFILEATRDDPALLAAVQMLLVGYEEAGGHGLGPMEIAKPSARAPGTVRDNEEPGAVIDHFRLVRLLGEGGMGSVWRAEQMAPVRRAVAFKVIKLGMDTREVVKRFGRERQTLALLNHPNIAQVFEAGATATGRPYFAMELVDGHPITVHCERAGFGVEERLRLFREVCAAVEHAHQKGVIHRDLKPSNILVADGVVKVIDFGVAKATQQAGDTPLFTRHAQILGTPAYMSPEQAQSAGLDIDTRTDVYALGVVLYELLAGVPPIDPDRLARTSIAEMQRILLEEEPPTPSARMEGLRTPSGSGKRPDRAGEDEAGALKEAPGVVAAQPNASPHLGSLRRVIQGRQLRGDLDWVVMKAIRKDRNERYPSAAALSEDLGRYLEGEPVSAVPPTLVYHAGKFVRRHKIAVVSALAVFLALAAATVLSTLMAVKARQASANETSARRETVKTLGRMYTRLALQNGREDRPAEAALWAARAAESSVDDPPEHEASLKRTAFWTEEVAIPLRAFKADFNEIRRMTFHPSERHLLAEERKGTLQIWDLDRETKMSFGEADRFGAAAWNTEGSLLALARPERNEVELHLFPEGTMGQPPIRDPANGSPVSSLAFNCNGTLLAAGAGKSVALYQRADRGTFHFLLSIPQQNTVLRIVFSPSDPNCLATALTNNLASLFSINPAQSNFATLLAAEKHLLLSRRVDSGEPPHFDKTGRTLTLTRSDVQTRYGLTTFDAASGGTIVQPQPLEGFPLAHSPDGRFVIYRQESDRLREMAHVALVGTGQNLSTLTFRRIATVAGFSGDGRRAIVASEDGQATVLAAPDWKPEFQLSLHASRVMGVALSPSGRLAATAQAGGLVRIWRTQAPHHSILPLGHDTRVALSRDGQRFALAGRSAADATLDFTQVYRTSDLRPDGPPLGSMPVSDSNGVSGASTRAGPIMDAAFSPDGNVLVIAQAAPGLPRESFATNRGSITFWNWRDGSRLGDPVITPSEPRSLAWHPDGTQVAVCCAAGQYLGIDPVTRRHSLLYEQGVAWAAGNPLNNGEIAYEASGSALVGWGIQREIQVWSLSRDGSRHQRVNVTSRCADVAMNAEGIIAFAQTGTRNGIPKVFLMEAASGRTLPDPLVHPEWLNSLAFDPPGKLLLTTARDGVVRVWDWRSRKLYGPPIQHRGSVYSGRFVPGTPYVVTGGDQGTFTIVDARSGIDIVSFAVAGSTSQILEIQVTPDGQTAIFGGKGLGGVGVVSLGHLHHASPLGLKDVLKLATLNASVRLDHESGLTALSADEWLAMWKEFRREFPDHHRF